MIKQFSHYQACWSEFLSHFDFKIVYHFEKVSDKSDAFTHWSEDFSKKKNNSDKYLLYQNQIILKKT